MHPVRMELAPHARLGRRTSAASAIFVLLIFHVTMIIVGALNWRNDCEAPLELFLIIYGGVGLTFVYILFREWLFYARLSSLPSLANLILLIVFYCCLSTAGGFLTYYTVLTHTTCGESAPLLYQWCQAAVLFFALITLLFLLVPLVRVLARLVLAPFALCIISCVETVGVDVEVGDGSGTIAGASSSGPLKPGSGRGGPKVARSAAAMMILAPCYLVMMPFYYLLKPCVGILTILCTPFGMGLMKLGTCMGCVVEDEEWVRCVNPFSGLSGVGCAQSLLQVTLAPGCIVPGRSLVALFVNTAALLWFFTYLGYDLYDSWEVVCESRNPSVPFNQDPILWLTSGAPSPIHWLLLLFSVAGLVLTILSFLHDMFAGPTPPPRSHYEAALWRGRRQVTVIGVSLLLMCLLGWGIALGYFTLLSDECARHDPSLYNIALLLVTLLGLIAVLALLLGCCIVLDCFISGRVRLLLLLSNPQAPPPPPAEQYTSTGNERLIPGVPKREAGSGGYGTGDAFTIGVEEREDYSVPRHSRLNVESARSGATWQHPDKLLSR